MNNVFAINMDWKISVAFSGVSHFSISYSSLITTLIKAGHSADEEITLIFTSAFKMAPYPK